MGVKNECPRRAANHISTTSPCISIAWLVSCASGSNVGKSFAIVLMKLLHQGSRATKRLRTSFQGQAVISISTIHRTQPLERVYSSSEKTDPSLSLKESSLELLEVTSQGSMLPGKKLRKGQVQVLTKSQRITWLQRKKYRTQKYSIKKPLPLKRKRKSMLSSNQQLRDSISTCIITLLLR